MQRRYTNVDEIFGTLSVPEIQTLEVDLRSQAASKRSELRLLVGESYRDLLTTADTIVDMREKIIVLRRQLSVLMSSCDSQMVTRTVSNLNLLSRSHESTKHKVILSYMADLRALVIHFVKRNELITAARLYTLGRLLSSTVANSKSDVVKRLKSVRGILIRAIIKCNNVHDFACSFAMLESANPQTCLTYFLSLQISNLKGCDSLQNLASGILRVIDITRDFGRLSDVFDQLSKHTLLSSIAQMPEVDAALLTQCVPDDLRHYKPFLRPDVLDASSIDTQVDKWLKDSATAIQVLASNIIQVETKITNILKIVKDVRGLLDEASKVSVYEFLSPAIDSHISSILKSSLLTISDLAPLLRNVIEGARSPENLWDSRIPWLKDSVHNFSQVTKRAVGGHSAQFSTFEKAYLSAIEFVKTNLEVLEKVKEHSTRREFYRAEAVETIASLEKQLYEIAEQGPEHNKIITILRLLRFIGKTSPVSIPAPTSTLYFRKLIPSKSFKFDVRNLSGIYENGYPITISPGLADFLYVYSHSISLLGIDIVGVEERAEVRKSMLARVEEAVQLARNHDVRVNGGGNDVSEKCESQRDDDDGTEEPMLPQHRPDAVQVAASTTITNGHSSLDETTDSKVTEETKIEPSSESSKLLQDRFDEEYIYSLFSAPSSALNHLAEKDRVTMHKNIDSALKRGRTLYGTLL